ncbi:hypothetical protein JCM9533A_19240 [Catenuloplanes niger JCM 9533]
MAGGPGGTVAAEPAQDAVGEQQQRRRDGTDTRHGRSLRRNPDRLIRDFPGENPESGCGPTVHLEE